MNVTVSAGDTAGERVAARPRRMERTFWVVSPIILLTDALFIYANHPGTQRTLHENLAADGARQETLFRLNLRNQGLHMQQFATYLASQPAVREFFLAGRRAVEREGGGAGGEQAARLRRQLYELISPGWQAVTGRYEVRQLHFHLGPGDTSFLRVHKPEKFGDDLSSITHSIRENKPTHGFESGRVYAGIRGVVPISTSERAPGEAAVVNALEAGSSFSQMLDVLEVDTATSYAVLMSRDYVLDTHWPDLAAAGIERRPLIDDWFIETTSGAVVVRRLMAEPAVAAS